jgi:hypothetical protein
MLDKPLLPHHRLTLSVWPSSCSSLSPLAAFATLTFAAKATRAAQSCCLNAAEGVARSTRAGKARALICRSRRSGRAAAAVEIAVLCGSARQADSDRAATIVPPLVDMLTRLGR